MRIKRPLTNARAAPAAQQAACRIKGKQALTGQGALGWRSRQGPNRRQQRLTLQRWPEQPAAPHCTLVLLRRAGGRRTSRNKAGQAGRAHTGRRLLAGRHVLLLRWYALRGPHRAARGGARAARHWRLHRLLLHLLALQAGGALRCRQQSV